MIKENTEQRNTEQNVFDALLSNNRFVLGFSVQFEHPVLIHRSLLVPDATFFFLAGSFFHYRQLFLAQALFQSSSS